jgi:hypothetical protein
LFKSVYSQTQLKDFNYLENMKKGISFQGFVPLRLEPDHSSEMISQLLFGETFCIKEESREWLLIDQDCDASLGWICRDSIQFLESPDAISDSETDLRIVSNPLVKALNLGSGRQVILPAGSSWHAVSETKSLLADSRFEVLSLDGLQKPGPEVDLEEAGQRLLSLPYIHGGRCGFGFDAPGLIQMLYSLKGLKLPRTTISQAELGSTVNFLHEVKAGDLAFFDNPEGEIKHVGLLLEGGRILHVHHQVRIDRFDQQGIYCPEMDRYTHKLRIIKRIDG